MSSKFKISSFKAMKHCSLNTEHFRYPVSLIPVPCSMSLLSQFIFFLLTKRYKIKMGPVYYGTHLKNIFCNNNRLPADPDMRTEVIKPIIKAVVTD